MFAAGADRPACLIRSCAADAAVQTMSSNPKLGAGYVSSFACFAVAWKAVHEAKAATESLDLPDKFKPHPNSHRQRGWAKSSATLFGRSNSTPQWAHF